MNGLRCTHRGIHYSVVALSTPSDTNNQPTGIYLRVYIVCAYVQIHTSSLEHDFVSSIHLWLTALLLSLSLPSSRLRFIS